MKHILLLFALVLSLASCKKEVQSFKLLGKWQVDTFTLNGDDQTTAFKAVFTDYVIDFNLDHDYVETYTTGGTPITVSGTWTVSDDGNDVELTRNDDHTVRNFHIVEVKLHTATFSEDAGTKVYKISNI